jgi:CheY-like chemotaxis protein
LTLENHPFDLENLLKDIGRTMSPISEAKKIELLCPANVSQNYELLGDEGRIKQILLNLISNAIKFTDIGHISVSVDTVRDHNHCILQFSIRDTGIGIPQSKVEHVFERFTQVDGSITRSAGGTGLGLAICSELINLMKGEISVTSALGQGSCFNFHIRLPIVSDLTLEKYDIDSALNIICMISNDALADTIVSFTESWGIKTFRLPNYSDLSSLLATKNPDNKLTLISDHGFLTGMSEQVESEQISLFNGIIFISSLLESMTPLNLPVTTLAMIKPIIPSELFNNILGLARKADSTHIVNKHLDKNTLAPLSAKLLLVEDDIINLKVAENILRKKGAEIITAMNGQEAIEALKSDTFDVVLMDCHMPIMDGYAATEAIRKGIAGQQNKDIPIIALTANAIAGEDERCFASGMSDYISKPFETSELINCIQKWLNR